MNSDTLQGTWNQIKGSVKQAFGKLTDDDLMQMEGSADRAVGVLQQRYGYTRERAQQEWDSFMQRSKSNANSMTNKATEFVQDTANRISNKMDQVADKYSNQDRTDR